MSEWMNDRFMMRAMEETIKHSEEQGIGGLEGTVLLSVRWSRKTSVIKWHLSRDLEEVKEQATGLPGGEDTRQMKQQVQRHCSWPLMLDMADH